MQKIEKLKLPACSLVEVLEVGIFNSIPGCSIVLSLDSDVSESN